MTERESGKDVGIIVTQSQSLFLDYIGFDVPEGTTIRFNEQHQIVLQAKAEGLNNSEIKARVNRKSSTTFQYITAIGKICSEFSSGNNPLNAAISLSVATGVVDASRLQYAVNAPLQEKEEIVLALMRLGYSNDEIGLYYHCSGSYINTIQKTVYEKLGIVADVHSLHYTAVAIATEASKRVFERKTGLKV